jgi:hypothetical protein
MDDVLWSKGAGQQRRRNGAATKFLRWRQSNSDVTCLYTTRTVKSAFIDERGMGKVGTMKGSDKEVYSMFSSEILHFRPNEAGWQ